VTINNEVEWRRVTWEDMVGLRLRSYRATVCDEFKPCTEGKQWCVENGLSVRRGDAASRKRNDHKSWME